VATRRTLAHEYHLQPSGADRQTLSCTSGSGRLQSNIVLSLCPHLDFKRNRDAVV